MDDTGTTDAAVGVAAQPTPQSFIGNDGALLDGWRDHYVPEDIRGEKVFDRATTLPNIFRSLASAERMVGADKMAIPTDKSGDDVWDAYYRIGGRPETPQEYGFARPEKLPEEFYSEEKAGVFAEAMHKLGLSKKQAQGLFDFYHADIAKALDDKRINDQIESDSLLNTLVNEQGNNFEAFKHLGNIAIKKGVNGDAEFKERLLAKMNKDADWIRFAGNLGSKFNESSGTTIPIAMQETKNQLQEKINEIMASDAFNQRNHPNHKSAMNNLQALYKQKNQNVKQPA